jgi:hypothetical protein
MKPECRKKSAAEKLIDTACIWHGATFLEPRCAPTANKLLHRAVIVYLKSQTRILKHQYMPKDQIELRAIVRRAVGNKVRKLNTYIRQIEAQSHRWKLKYKTLLGQTRSHRDKSESSPNKGAL